MTLRSRWTAIVPMIFIAGVVFGLWLSGSFRYSFPNEPLSAVEVNFASNQVSLVTHTRIAEEHVSIMNVVEQLAPGWKPACMLTIGDKDFLIVHTDMDTACAKRLQPTMLLSVASAGLDAYAASGSLTNTIVVPLR